MEFGPALEGKTPKSKTTNKYRRGKVFEKALFLLFVCLLILSFISFNRRLILYSCTTHKVGVQSLKRDCCVLLVRPDKHHHPLTPLLPFLLLFLFPCDCMTLL